MASSGGSISVIVGVDVGGTNTDAVVLKGKNVVSSAKFLTTADVTSGVAAAITSALNQAHNLLKGEVCVSRVHIGTTHFVNAVVQRQNMVKVAILRLCGPSTTGLPPYSNFPADLKEIVCGGVYLLNGGYEFDGKTEISPLDDGQLKKVAEKIKADNIRNIAICGVFSPVNSGHEKQAAAALQSMLPAASITMSSAIGSLGLLERENAAILNESLRPLAQQTITAFRSALNELGLRCPFYLSQNDGTLLSAEQALELPVHTFASGPTNSMRGATFLSGLSEAVVVDIGGTTCDVGMIVKGFPRETGVRARIGGVTTNFRMPDVLSIGLGGGSIVKYSTDSCTVGPESVGYRLQKEALVFGGGTITATDIAVAAGLVVDIGEKERVAHLNKYLVDIAQVSLLTKLETTIDQVRVSSEDVVVVLVGGGSVLIDPNSSLSGVSQIIKPPSYAVANAVGAALSQVSNSVDRVVSLGEISREEAIKEARQMAIAGAVTAGANRQSMQIVDIMEVPLAYLPGNATRVKVKVVGDLQMEDVKDAIKWDVKAVDSLSGDEGVTQVGSSTGGSLMPTGLGVEDYLAAAMVEVEPTIDVSTGEWHLSGWDVECIAVGAGILGCGGGGSPERGRLQAHLALNEGKVIRVVHPERLERRMKEHDSIAPIAGMGAPTIGIERVRGAVEYLNAFRAMEDLYSIGNYDDESGLMEETEDTKVKTSETITYMDDYHPKIKLANVSSDHKLNIVAVASGEIGGSNAFAPILLASMTDLPVVDCDAMGRAFPELQMCVPLMNGVKPYPATLANHSDRRAVVLRTDNPKALEDHFRDVVCEMGCGGALLNRPLRKDEMMTKMVKHSVSRAWKLGRTVIHARRNNMCPIKAIVRQEGAHLLGSGKIDDIVRRTIGGFARGELILKGLGDCAGRTFKVEFQNENLVAAELQHDGTLKVLACTPDLLSLVNTDSGQPVATEEVRYGLRVTLLAMPAPPDLTTKQALKVVGPQAFGYPVEEVKYVPLGTYVQHQPIPPE